LGGQEAVGEAARTVTVTSLVTLTCSMSRSERAGRMLIGLNYISNMSDWKNLFGSLFYHIFAAASLRKKHMLAVFVLPRRALSR
jgi:hypothetical protein